MPNLNFLREMEKMGKPLKNKTGFTLVEMLIVIVVLGILAMIILPQFYVSSEDTKISTLKTNLFALRKAVEAYSAQHGNRYPGQSKSSDGVTNNDATEAAASMVKQLTQYTNTTGKVSGTRDSTFKFGPYVKGGQMPRNPFNIGKGLLCDNTKSITKARAVSAGTGVGWKFHFNTGVLYANDGRTLNDGTNTSDL